MIQPPVPLTTWHLHKQTKLHGEASRRLLSRETSRDRRLAVTFFLPSRIRSTERWMGAATGGQKLESNGSGKIRVIDSTPRGESRSQRSRQLHPATLSAVSIGLLGLFISLSGKSIRRNSGGLHLFAPSSIEAFVHDIVRSPLYPRPSRRFLATIFLPLHNDRVSLRCPR